MNKPRPFSIRLLSLLFIILLLSACAATMQQEEGGIGGTGHTDSCQDRPEDEKCER